MDREYMLRIIKGEGTPEERERFFERVSGDGELAREYARMKNKHIVGTLPYSPGAETLLGRKNPKRGFLSTLTKIAAVLFIPLLAYCAYDFFGGGRKTQDGIFKTIAAYETGTGVRYLVNTGIKASLTLPDSTRVWLNSGSCLDVPGDFGKDNRLVFLSGEGYFAVESDPASPFLIKTPRDIVVRVTGTEFNLSCYENDPGMKLTLLKGSLELIREKSNEVIVIKPNEQVVIDYRSRQDKLDAVADTGYATAWKEGNLRFEEAPMDEVVRKLERWYGVHITVENNAIFKHSFTADFESESISQVLGLLKVTANISHEIDGNRVRLY